MVGKSSKKALHQTCKPTLRMKNIAELTLRNPATLPVAPNGSEFNPNNFGSFESGSRMAILR
jgi:hypothetical protein